MEGVCKCEPVDGGEEYGRGEFEVDQDYWFIS